MACFTSPAAATGGMASPDLSDPDPSARRIVLDFELSDDPELTCMVCGHQGVDLETTVRDGRGSRITMGKHSGCAWRPVRPVRSAGR